MFTLKLAFTFDRFQKVIVARKEHLLSFIAEEMRLKNFCFKAIARVFS